MITAPAGSPTRGTPVAGRVVVVTGATGVAGQAVCAELIDNGASVIAVASDVSRLADLQVRHPLLTTQVCDLADFAAVTALADSIGPVDGVIHLVGGWRGGGGLVGQSDADWEFLVTALVATLRNVTRAFHTALLHSDSARVVIVGATAAAAPTAGNANYAAAKAAAQAWMGAVADSFRLAQSGHRTAPTEQTAAALTLVIKALVTEADRHAQPEKSFPGFTDTRELARTVVGLWSRPAAELNGAAISLIS
ncbi:SDR family NAD(P)-dependent oxidoreductase [Nakamurella antarctica]|uniref:SDR family NAD(P)-dependent oxidoreductase n=1 Tax=Nakamurella antarctica TaxID=1902245 RepID=A0A3G8ZJ94_9ACTN|nr:SDR family NAD(P)-dependent oxidoreductase [Nakamurella antarctica]AZI57343.1 SDR family NAD(P)-dependent oxidoreductase [Nakamurella antarctica]